MSIASASVKSRPLRPNAPSYACLVPLVSDWNQNHDQNPTFLVPQTAQIVRLVLRRRRVNDPPDTAVAPDTTILRILGLDVAPVDRDVQRVHAVLPAHREELEDAAGHVIDDERHSDFSLFVVVGRRVREGVQESCEILRQSCLRPVR